MHDSQWDAVRIPRIALWERYVVRAALLCLLKVLPILE
jgi:hypothetical protein